MPLRVTDSGSPMVHPSTPFKKLQLNLKVNFVTVLSMI